MKFNARLCYRGDLHKDPHPSFSAVAKWTTIPVVLAFALNINFATKQIDFSNAFVQDILPNNMNKYTEILNAQGFVKKINNHLCMKFHKSLYIMVEAPLLWFKAISRELIDEGFVASKADPSLFLHSQKNIINITYVDDCLFFL